LFRQIKIFLSFEKKEEESSEVAKNVENVSRKSSAWTFRQLVILSTDISPISIAYYELGLVVSRSYNENFMTAIDSNRNKLECWH